MISTCLSFDFLVLLIGLLFLILGANFEATYYVTT